MNKIYILSNDIKFLKALDSLFDKVSNKVEILNIKPDEAFKYICNHPCDFIITNNTYLNGFYQLFDMLINANKCSIIYVSPNNEEGILYNAMSSPNFYMINLDRISSIPDLMKLMERDIKIINSYKLDIDKYKDKINEERLVKKAKLYLMTEYNIKEDEAYKKILKKSMDERISKLESAKAILGGR